MAVDKSVHNIHASDCTNCVAALIFVVLPLGMSLILFAQQQLDLAILKFKRKTPTLYFQYSKRLADGTTIRLLGHSHVHPLCEDGPKVLFDCACGEE